MRAPWVGNIIAALLGLGGGAAVLAVTTATTSRVTEVRVDGLKEAIHELGETVKKLDAQVDRLTEAVARLES